MFFWHVFHILSFKYHLESGDLKVSIKIRDKENFVVFQQKILLLTLRNKLSIDIHFYVISQLSIIEIVGKNVV